MILRQLVDDRSSAPLQTNIRQPYGEVARKLHVDEETVRSRIKKIHESGFIRGWYLVVNPHLLDMKMTSILFDVPSAASKDDLIRKLKLIHGAVAIIGHYGRSMGVILFYESEESVKKDVELISRLSNTENLLRVETPFPECSADLSKKDWGIIGALQREPRKHYNLVAEELGLSPKTAKRRIKRLIEEKALFAVPSVDPKALKGAIVADLVVLYADSKYKKELDESVISHLDHCLLRAETGDREHALFNLILSNVAEADEIIRWVREQRGVGRAELELVQDRIELYDTMHELLNRKIAQVLAIAE